MLKMTSKKSSKSSKSGKLKQISTDEIPGTEISHHEVVKNSITDISVEDDCTINHTSLKKEESDVVPDGPTLTEIIVENYIGDRENGHFHGPGKIYFTNGNVYEGELVNGMMHGRGRFSWLDSHFYFDGEFEQNNISGKGIYHWPDGSTYEGEVLFGIRHGYGIYSHPNGIKYIGNWQYGKKSGKGKLIYNMEETCYYEGDWLNDKRHGFGVQFYPSGNMYEGMWYNGFRHGQGTMNWFDKDEIYTGQWEDGVQHGNGQHVWIVKRIASSQFLLRNCYEGEFYKSKRHGYGIFSYPSGARYEGYWLDDMKNGEGKFVFKNGRVFEGLFKDDRMVEFPNFDGRLSTPDTSTIRTRSPLPDEANSIHSNISINTISPSFHIALDHLFVDEKLGDVADIEEEIAQVNYVAIHFLGKLRRAYNYYAQLGCQVSKDNTHVMTLLQFWRFVKDCRLHNEDWTLISFDREICESYEDISFEAMHNPSRKVLFLDFVNHLVTISYLLYGAEFSDKKPILSQCFRKLITRKVLPNACSVRGYLFSNPNKTMHAVNYLDRSYRIYLNSCQERKRHPKYPTLTFRHFIHLLQDMNLINEDLTAVKLVDIFCFDDDYIRDGDFLLLDREMTFLEFFEALIGCSEVYVTSSLIQTTETTDPLAEIVVRLTAEVEAESSKAAQPIVPDESVLQVPEPINDTTSQAEGDTGENPVASPSTELLKSPAEAQQSKSKVSDTTKADSRKAKASSKSLHPDSNRTSKEPSKDRQASRNSKEDKKSNIESKKSARSNEKENLDSDTPTTTVVDVSPDQANLVDASQVQSETSIQNIENDDEAAERQFNFWTHQIHEFFLNRFFPVAEFFEILQSRINVVPSRASSGLADSQLLPSPESDSRRNSETLVSVYPEKENTHFTTSEATEGEG